MISDTLSDAKSEIEEYLARMPKVYKEYVPEIKTVLHAMDQLRSKLDAFPNDVQ